MDLRSLRERAGLTQMAAAELTEISYPAWRKWEYGEMEPRMKIGGFRRLMEVLDVDFDELETAIGESMKQRQHLIK